MRHHALSRRTVLAGAVAGLVALPLTGCAGSQWYPSDISPGEYLLRSAIADKERLIRSYTAASGQGPTELLSALLAHHERHLAELRARLPPDAAAAPSPSPNASASSAAEAPASVAALRVAEESAAAQRARQAAQAPSRSLAQLLASIGACEAGHAHLLLSENL